MTDARFEDADPGPLRLTADDAEGLAVISALVQDAVFPITEMTWARPRRRFALMLNRLRHEDIPDARRMGRAIERVQSLLVFDEVLAVQVTGIDRGQKDTVLALLGLTFEPGTEGAGRVILTLAGDGALALTVEALDVHLRDVTRPYAAPSGKVPDHGV